MAYLQIDNDTGETVKNRITRIDENGKIFELKSHMMNYVINFYSPERVELLYIPKGYCVAEEVAKDVDFINDQYTFVEFENIMNQRKWVQQADGKLIPARENVRLEDLLSTMYKTGKRARKTFFGYALANYWEYFCTFSLDAKKVDRFNKSAVNECWSTFRRKMQYKYPNIKLLCSAELHEFGGFHFHALVSNCDLKLVPARNNDIDSKYYGKFLYSTFEHQLFNTEYWDYGFSTIACIPPADNQLKVANYCGKYITKSFANEWSGKRFFSTHNLNDVESYNGYSTDIKGVIKSLGLKEYCTSENMIIFRTFDDGTVFVPDKIKTHGGSDFNSRFRPFTTIEEAKKQLGLEQTAIDDTILSKPQPRKRYDNFDEYLAEKEQGKSFRKYNSSLVQRPKMIKVEDNEAYKLFEKKPETDLEKAKRIIDEVF